MENPRFFYRTEVDDRGVERHFAVAYQYDSETGAASYGASVFRRDNPKEVYVKASHRNTARARFTVRPVQFSLPTNLPLSDVEQKIREALPGRGVKGPRLVVGRG